MDHSSLSPTRYLPPVARWLLQGALPADPMEALGAAPRGRLLELRENDGDSRDAGAADAATSPQGWAA